MKTFDSQHWKITGYHPEFGWFIYPLRDDSFYIVAKVAKFVDAGKVEYLQEDGSVEDKTGKKLFLLNTEE